jgi:dTDP-4-amino-4,6-dideoxygalactose transaminase
MSQQPMYFDAGYPSLNASRFAGDGLCLPTYTGLTASEQDFIIDQVRHFHDIH